MFYITNITVGSGVCLCSVCLRGVYLQILNSFTEMDEATPFQFGKWVE